MKALKVGTYVIQTTCWTWRNSFPVCWNVRMVWVTCHNHKCTTPLKYSLDCLYLNMNKVDKDTVIGTNHQLWKQITWISHASIRRKMAHYKTLFLYGHTSILCNGQCDRAVANLIASARDWDREICTNTFRRKNLPFVSSGVGFWRALCLPLVFFMK